MLVVDLCRVKIEEGHSPCLINEKIIKNSFQRDHYGEGQDGLDSSTKQKTNSFSAPKSAASCQTIV